MKAVKLADLWRLKGKDLLRVSEEIDAIRRYRPMTTSFPLNKVDDELRDFRSRDNDKAVRVLNSFFSHGERDLDNELSDPFEEDCYQGQLSENSSSFKASDSGVNENVDVFFSSAVGSFGGGPEGSELLVARSASDDFSDEPGVLFDRHMFNEAVVVHKVGAGLRVLL